MKKALSLILALTLCLGLAVPALAATDSYGYRLGEYSLIGASEEPVGAQTFTHYFYGYEEEALVFPAGTVIRTVSANSSAKFIARVYDITNVEYDAELVEKAKVNGFDELGISTVATKVRDFTLEPETLYEICVVYGEMQESVYVATPADSANTDDVYEDPTVSAWAEAEIKEARSCGLIPDLTGAPSMQDTITREQFAELIVNYLDVLGVDIPDGDTSFVDCDNPAVLLAASAGIVNGVGNNKFDPNTTTNREQIATMIYRAIKYVESLRDQNPASKAGSIDKYTDKDAVSDWAAEGVGVLAANGIMKGTSDTTLSPKNPCTVEQSIILIYRLFNAYFAD